MRSSLGAALVASLFAAGAASAAKAVNRPYLQSVTPSSAVVVFRADQACPAEVRFAPTAGGTEQVAASTKSQAQHEVKLEGLQPATEYRYTVQACGSPLEPEHTFRTAPAPGTTDVHFAAIGDFGKGTAEQTATANQILAHDPEVIVTVGDNIYSDGTDAEFTSNFLRPMGALFAEVPLYPAFGNHDYAADDLATSLKNFVVPTNNPIGTERYYSVDWGNVHFVMLDSICLIGDADSSECDVKQQLAWLDSDLKATNAHWKVIMLHNVLFSSAKYGARPEEVGPMREMLLPIFEANGVDLVLSGDDHVYERSKPMSGTAAAPAGTRGITYVVTGHGAEGRNWAMNQQAWSAYRNNTDVGFLDVKTQGGTLTARMIGADGKTYDTFTIEKPLPPGAATPVKLTSTAVEPSSGKAPLEVLFSASAQPEDAQVTWTFAPGQTATGREVRYRFDVPGAHEVQVEARKGDQVSRDTVTVTVEADEPGTTEPQPEPGKQPSTPGTIIETSNGESGDNGDSGQSTGTAKGCTAAGGSVAFAGLAALLFMRRRRVSSR